MQGHGFRARAFRMRKITVGLGTVALLATAFAGLPASASGAAGVVYAHTIGGPGHASMYASGLDVDSSGNVYIADTGNDQVAAYSPTGKQLWRVGVRGTKQLGRFNNPRDVAYLNGKLYVDDTGWNRVQVLNASNGAAISQWPVHFGSTLGITAGVDGSGNHVIFVSEDIQNRVQEFTPAGALIRTFGTGLGSGLGQLNAPRDAATDSAGNVYVADYNNNRIAKFSPTGAPLKGWGTRGSANDQFIRPYGVAVDAANRVYVADSDNNRIQQFSATGGYLRTYGTPGTGARQFFQLRRVAVGTGSSPLVYGADLWGNKILRFSQTGVYQATYGGTPGRNGGFNEPSGLAVDSQTFVSDSVNQRVQRFATATGAWQLSFGNRGWGKTDLTGFNWPRDITINNATNTIWVSDTKNNRLLQFTRDGVPTGSFLGEVGSAPNQLHWPFGIASAGANLIVADTFNNRVSRWSPTLGTTTWLSTAFSFPKDVAVANGVVYVADTGNNRVVELSALTGAPIRTFGGLHGPEGIAVDAAGNIWVSDTAWNRIVELSPSGSLLLAFGSAGSAHNQFNHPSHLEISNGQLFVSDEYNDRIEVYDLP
jgi:tripartite motif-containing protein 71